MEQTQAEHNHEKLKDIFENTVDSDLKYEGKVKNIEYYSLFCKAASEEQLFKILGNNVCMFNYEYKGEDSIIMLFSLPINVDEMGAKTVAERVMQVVTTIEECFITLDYVSSEEVQEDRFVYITAIKKI